MLAHKGIDYEYKAVSLIKDGGQQHTEEYKAINPMEQVPALVAGDLCLSQSVSNWYISWQIFQILTQNNEICVLPLVSLSTLVRYQ